MPLICCIEGKMEQKNKLKSSFASFMVAMADLLILLLMPADNPPAWLVVQPKHKINRRGFR